MHVARPLVVVCVVALTMTVSPRMALDAPAAADSPRVVDLWSEADDVSDIYLNGVIVSGQHLPYCGWPGLSNIEHVSDLPLVCGPNLMAIEARDMCGAVASVIAWFTCEDGYGGMGQYVTNAQWLASRNVTEGWNNDYYYNDGAWAPAVENGSYSSWPITDPSVVAPESARWIWDAPSGDLHAGAPVYIRFKFYIDSPTGTGDITWGQLKALHR